MAEKKLVVTRIHITTALGNKGEFWHDQKKSCLDALNDHALQGVKKAIDAEIEMRKNLKMKSLTKEEKKYERASNARRAKKSKSL